MDTAEGQWSGWNWRTEGDMMVNGAFFVPSGEGMEEIYDKASSTDPKSSALVDALTQNAGVLGDPRCGAPALPSPRELSPFARPLFLPSCSMAFVHARVGKVDGCVPAGATSMVRVRFGAASA